MSGEQVAAVVARVASKPGFGRAVFYASPNPVPVDGSGLGQTTVYWVAPRATKLNCTLAPQLAHCLPQGVLREKPQPASGYMKAQCSTWWMQQRTIRCKF